MKLYTEEQLLKAVAFGVKFCKNNELPSGYTIVQYVESLTPIELPSDEDIEKQSKYIAHNNFDMHNTNHYQGLLEGAHRMAYWMRDKIQGGNK